MTGKERIFAVMQNKETDKTPWVPFAGVHSGKLKGYTAREVSTDPEKLVESLLEVNRLYKPDGQPVMFDLQIEAEILGCDLVWSDDAPPTVSTHPLSDTQEIPDKMPEASDGRIGMELEAMKKIKKEIGDNTALYGLFCGPFTLASHLRGTNIFMDMILDPDYVQKLMEYTTNISKRMIDFFIDAGMDVLAVVDPLISQISPDHFGQFMDQPFSEIFSYIRDKGALSSFFVCGNATMNIDPMCRTKPDSISVDENVDLAKAKKVTDQYNIVIGGNIPLTSIMLFGNQQDNMKATVELIDSLTPGNAIIAPGCDMPYDIPVENVLGIEQAVHETETVREMIKNYEGSNLEFEGELPDYPNLQKPLIEVFTLDSATCAACTYMLASAVEAKEEYFGDAIDVVEYKYTTKQNIARCMAMGVKQLPSIYINGELAYSSIIPSRDELIQKVKEVM
ncbi:MAG: uroporphyrinogen decarboxylase [Spirochaetia bacterium]|nr:uroporphyrinogen decarboxylase [Spirochaetia bacterium]